MRKRVDIIMPDGKRRRAYVSTRSSASHYGIPVIEIGNVPHGPNDLSMRGAIVVTGDDELRDLLLRHGFAAKAKTFKAVGASISEDLHNMIKAKAAERGTSVGAIIEEALALWLDAEGGP